MCLLGICTQFVQCKVINPLCASRPCARRRCRSDHHRRAATTTGVLHLRHRKHSRVVRSRRSEAAGMPAHNRKAPAANGTTQKPGAPRAVDSSDDDEQLHQHDDDTLRRFDPQLVFGAVKKLQTKFPTLLNDEAVLDWNQWSRRTACNLGDVPECDRPLPLRMPMKHSTAPPPATQPAGAAAPAQVQVQLVSYQNPKGSGAPPLPSQWPFNCPEPCLCSLDSVCTGHTRSGLVGEEVAQGRRRAHWLSCSSAAQFRGLLRCGGLRHCVLHCECQECARGHG